MSKLIKWLSITLAVVVAAMAIGIGSTAVSAATPSTAPNGQTCSGGGGGFDVAVPSVLLFHRNNKVASVKPDALY